MDKAIRIKCRQKLVNYRKPASFIIKETYPLPPYSTILGMIHNACGFIEYHDMKISVQGISTGTVSDLYTRYSFRADNKYEADRHQICIENNNTTYGVFKGIANTELICEIELVIHIVPNDDDFNTVLFGLQNPKNYLSLGRHEDLVDIYDISVVELSKADIEPKYDIYIPLNSEEDIEGTSGTIYSIGKKYEIDKKSGIRRMNRIKTKFVCKNLSCDEFDDFLSDGEFPVALV